MADGQIELLCEALQALLVAALAPVGPATVEEPNGTVTSPRGDGDGD